MEGFSASAEVGRPRGGQREGRSGCVTEAQDTLGEKKNPKVWRIPVFTLRRRK